MKEIRFKTEAVHCFKQLGKLICAVKMVGLDNWTRKGDLNTIALLRAD